MNEDHPFRNRQEAGEALAERLLATAPADVVVLALPRGGVPVAAPIARALKAPLDIVLVRKIGVPFQPELAVAAVVDGDHPELVVNDEVRMLAGVDQDYIEEQARVELDRIERRRALYLRGRAQPPISGRSAIIVDDGLATGTTARAVIRALRRKRSKALILAVPVAPRETVDALRPSLDDIVCLRMPEDFQAIGMHYLDFQPVPDEEVVSLLQAADRDLQRAMRGQGS